MPKQTPDDLSDALVATINRFFRGRPIWHGALWPHVAKLTPRQAAWRPALDRHCIWEIVRHVIFWRQWLVAHAAGARKQEWRAHNWTMPERTDTESWRRELRRLWESQRALAALFRATPSGKLLERNRKGGFERFWWLGVLAHDSYHTGQIAVLRAMMGLKPID